MVTGWLLLLDQGWLLLVHRWSAGSFTLSNSSALLL